MNKFLTFYFLLFTSSFSLGAAWPEATQAMKPWAYNWWMGSAIDQKGIEYQCTEMEAKGFGGFHVIPIYGAKGYENQWRDLLSPAWLEAWNLAAQTARKHHLGIDLTMGSGWCFGGPWVASELGASSEQPVKRSGPGGHGLMIDPFSAVAMSNHVAQFEAAFGKGGTAERPRAFYHDSYEYYNALPKHGEDIDESQLACFKVWTDWCRENGYLTRNEAHGAPCNWLDFYALADIPETEMFGKKDRDILISKFASSAAHVKGTRLVSAESCTWIDEHFCERPCEIKAFLDRLFLSGVNHVFYHGLCYSPVDAVWPGWCFYASLEMNPRNPIWREVGALNEYITRCQSLFQTWTPDNDLAIVWNPDTYRKKKGNYGKLMSVHGIDWFYGERIGKTAKKLYADGYCFDYISQRQLKTADTSKYAEIIDPEKGELPKKARKHPFGKDLLVTRWRTDEGETAYFVVNPTKDVYSIGAEQPFVVMDPLSGSIFTAQSTILNPSHSLFIVGTSVPLCLCVKKATPVPTSQPQPLTSTFTATPICGGPDLPPAHTLAAQKDATTLQGWETWAEFFSGTMRYTTTFATPSSTSTSTSHFNLLSLGDVREIARVKLNGVDLGVKFMPPYEFAIPKGVLKARGNALEIEVTNLGANRIRWNDLKRIPWKYFMDINLVDINYNDFNAAKWKPKVSGLIGPVTLN